MCPILQTIQESLVFVGRAKTAAEIEYRIVVLQGQGVQEFLQFLKSITNLRRVTLMGFTVGLVELLQYSFIKQDVGCQRKAEQVGQ